MHDCQIDAKATAANLPAHTESLSTQGAFYFGFELRVVFGVCCFLYRLLNGVDPTRCEVQIAAHQHRAPRLGAIEINLFGTNRSNNDGGISCASYRDIQPAF